MTIGLAALAGLVLVGQTLFIVFHVLPRRRSARPAAHAPPPSPHVRALATHRDVARVLAESNTVDEAAPRLAQAVAGGLAWDVGVIWQVADGAGEGHVDADGHGEPGLRRSADWGTGPFFDFQEAARHRGFARGEGLPGAAWATGRPQWADVRDGGLLADGLAADCGLRTAVAFPLTGRDGVLGVMQLLSAAERALDADDLADVATLGRVIGGFLERRRSDDQRIALLESEQEAHKRRDRAERQASFLAEAGPLLSASLDTGSTASTVCRLAVPELADFCAVDLLDGDGNGNGDGRGPRRLAIAHASRSRERRAWESAHRNEDAAVRRAIATDAPVLIPAPDPMLVEVGLIDEAHLAMMSALDLTAALVVPIRSPSGLFGTITLAMGPSDRAIGSEDLVVAEGLADRAAQALVNARLFEAERAARADAERSEHELRRAEERFRTAFEHAPIGVALVSMAEGDRGRFLQVNPALCQTLGLDADELLARSFSDVTHPDDRESSDEQVDEMLAGRVPQIRLEKRYVHSSGHPVWCLVRSVLVRDADGAPIYTVSMVQDITDRKRYEGQLQYLADHDALTGLFNRRRFEEELDRSVAHVRRFEEPAAVLVVDLDHFKYVNDTYGHAVGDDLLGRVAGALRERLRETDVLGRLGGDEFGVILPRTTELDAIEASRNLIDAVRQEGVVTVGERRVRVTSSIGIRPILAQTELTAGELLVEADVAMYEAKEAGRDRVAAVREGEAPRARMRARQTWSERIRDALDHDRFELWEQPIQALERFGEDRSEVLVRMLGADGDAIPPGVFMYIAERFGQVQAIDRWVIGRSIELMAERRRHGRDHVLEVNLSGASITDEGVIDFIASEVANAPIDPTRLVFEVTETTAIVNVERARRFARRLADLGCQFALDDFGAGFGSFYYLKHLPFDCVKIDGDFVKELPSSPPDQLTVQAIVRIASGLGKETVAEYVQDEDTLALLREFGVDFAQGYHVGRPRPARDWLGTRHRSPA